jgi:RNA polymerase sigma-70 factor (ECF subfamily)
MARQGRPKRHETPSAGAHLSALIARVADGDRSALATLYDATSSLVFSLALRILRDRAAAEDVTIEVFMQVYSHAVGYQPDRGTPTGWLLTLARSRAIDRRRADANRAEREDPIEATAPLVASDPDPEEASSAAERRRLARAALASLAPEQRQVIEIAYFTGQSHGDIAARLGLPLGTVKTRIRTGMARLRSLLAPLGAEEDQ